MEGVEGWGLVWLVSIGVLDCVGLGKRVGLGTVATFGDDELADAGAEDGFAVGEARVGGLAGAFELDLVADFGRWVGGFEEGDSSLYLFRGMIWYGREDELRHHQAGPPMSHCTFINEYPRIEYVSQLLQLPTCIGNQ